MVTSDVNSGLSVDISLVESVASELEVGDDGDDDSEVSILEEESDVSSLLDEVEAESGKGELPSVEDEVPASSVVEGAKELESSELPDELSDDKDEEASVLPVLRPSEELELLSLLLQKNNISLLTMVQI